LDGLSSDDLVLDPIEHLNRYTYHGEDHWNRPYLSLFYMWFVVLFIFRCLKRHQEVNSLSCTISLFHVLIKKSTRPLLSRTKIPILNGRKLRLLSDRICGQLLYPLQSMTEIVVSLRPAFMEMQKFAYSLLGRVNLYLLFQFCPFGVDFCANYLL